MQCLIGNHEHALLPHYHALMEASLDDFDEVLDKLQAYFPADDDRLDWEMLDALDSLPYYREGPGFLCVHAGVALDDHLRVLPPAATPPEILIYDRRFKDPAGRHQTPLCVFFGHTQTDAICGHPAILAYRRTESPTSITDFDKIHLDTGAWSRGTLGCFCLDTLSATHVTRQ